MVFRPRISPATRYLSMLAAALLIAACGKSQAPGGFAPPPAEVTTVTVASKDFPVAFEHVAQTVGSKDVEVRARVTGIVEKRLYQEGSPVPIPKIATVPVVGGALHFVSQVPLGTHGLAWSPSGKGLQVLFLRNGASNIWEQPLSGGPPHQITNFASDRINSFAWSRDGKQLFMTKGNTTADVILISNFR